MTEMAQGLIHRFVRHRGGNVAILFGLLVVPLLVMAGGAVDLNRYVRYKAQLQSALDASIIALARQELENINENDFVDSYVRSMMAAETNSETGSGILFVINGVRAEIDLDSRLVEASADAKMETAFLKLIALNTMPLELTATAEIYGRQIDIALVVDNTGSMANNDRIQSLRRAASDFVEDLVRLTRADGQIQVAVVPYTNTVNIKVPGSFDEAWIDTGGDASLNGHFFDHPDPPEIPRSERNHWSLFQRFAAIHYASYPSLPPAGSIDFGEPNRLWKGCVEARAGAPVGGSEHAGSNGVNPNSFDVTDASPDQGDPNSLFVPYFYPDEPGPIRPNLPLPQGFRNTYLEDGIAYEEAIGRPDRDPILASRMWHAIADTSKYDAAEPTISYQAIRIQNTYFIRSTGPNRSCPEPLLDLTDVRSTDGRSQILRKLVEPPYSSRMSPPTFGTALHDGSGTNAILGAAWGWRALSPEEPFAARRATIEDPVQKIMIIFTDGENLIGNTAGGERLTRSDYNSYGFLADFNSAIPHRLRHTHVNPAGGHVNARFRVLCEHIKAENITIYGATLDVRSAIPRELLRNCASVDENGDPRYRDLKAGEIGDFFDDILADLSTLRITQ